MHIGDLHLGRSLGEFDLIEDQKYVLDEIFALAGEQHADAVLIAGDVFDKSVPSEAAVRLFDEFLNRLAAAETAVFVISGNHDSDERLNFGSSLFEASRIYISAKYEGKLYCRTLNDEFGEIRIWLLPYVKASQVRHFYPDEKIESYEDAVRVILKKAGINPEERNIIISHQFVTGENCDPEIGGSEGLSVESVGLVEKISYRCFSDFDYAALGHIHSPQRAGREEVRYCGSPLKYSLSEVNSTKSVPIVTLAEKGQVKIELVPLKPQRDLRHLKGPRAKLFASGVVDQTDDFIYITFTDEDFLSDAMGIAQQYYPNTVKIDYENSQTRAAGQLDFGNMAEQKSFDELIAAFYREMYGTEMTEEEKTLLKEAAGEAGLVE